jgi:hypothetical protein
MSSVEMDEWEWDGQAGRGVGGMPEGPTAEEGRGERRNVDGELQASYEPSDSEWGNPRTRNRSHRRLVNAPCTTIGANSKRTDFALAA